jgi:hypothetical protein
VSRKQEGRGVERGERGGTRRNEEERGGTRMNEEERGGTRRNEEERGGARRREKRNKKGGGVPKAGSSSRAWKKLPW